MGQMAIDCEPRLKGGGVFKREVRPRKNVQIKKGHSHGPSSSSRVSDDGRWPQWLCGHPVGSDGIPSCYWSLGFSVAGTGGTDSTKELNDEPTITNLMLVFSFV